MPALSCAVRLLGGGALLILPAAALAQEPIPLPPSSVTAAAGSLTVPNDADRAATLRLNPGNVTVVPAESFRDRGGVTTLRDALEFTPGVFVQPKWGEDSRLSIRGSGLARNFHLRGVRLFQDGIPLNQADGSGDFQELDPLTLQRLEVLRGGNAFSLGANTLGGAINGVTPTGRLQPGGLIRGEGGSYEFARGQVAYGIAAGAWDSWASITGLTQEGFRENSASRSFRFNGNVGAQLTPDVETRFYLTYNNIWQQIPGTITREQALTTPRIAAPANRRLNYRRDIESTRLGWITTARPIEGVLLEGGIGYVNRKLDHPIFQYIDNQNDDFNFFGRATLEGRVATLPSRTVVGFNVANGVTDNRRFVNLFGNAGALTYRSSDRARTSDLYAESSLEVLPDFSLIAGLQLGEARRVSTDRFLSDGDQSGRGQYRWINPRFGALWQARPDTQVFANLTWSTEPPTFSDLIALVPQGGFSRLDEQRARTVEIGTRGDIGGLKWEFAFYRSWIRDEIQLFTLPNNQSFALNADRTIHQGVEFGLDWPLARNAFAVEDSLVLRQAYTFSDFRFDGDRQFGDNVLPGAPSSLYRAELRYAHPVGAWFAPTLEWVPQSFYVDNANTLKTDAYAIVGLRGGMDFGNGLQAFVEARNLADTKYISSASVIPRAATNSALFEPGFGRAVFGGLQFRF